MRILISILATITLLLNSVSLVGAQEKLIAPFPGADSSAGILGQDHYYSVIMRGNGEAVVTAKIIFSNQSEEPLSTLQFQVPRVQPENVIAYQVQRGPECIRYAPYPTQNTPLKINPDGSSDFVPMDQRSAVTNDALYIRDPSCLEYRDPDYYNWYYGNTKYNKSEVSVEGDTLTVSLPTPVEPSKSGSILLYYRGMGYVNKSWSGSFNYTFESLKVNENIRTLQIGISTDNDLVMKDALADVNYRTTMESSGMAKMDMAAPTAASNAQFDQIYQNIGYGMINKNASQLQPLDSYTVKGEYAKSSWQLYANEVLWAVIAIVVFIILGVLAARFALGKLKRESNGKGITNRDVVIAGITGFVAAFLMLAYTIVVMLVYWTFISRNAYMYYEMVPFLTMGLMIVSSAVYMFLFITPAIVLGVKRGLWTGVVTAVVTILWLFVFLAFFLLGYLVLAMGRNPGYPVMPMMRGLETDMMKSAPAQVGSETMMSEPAVEAMPMESGTSQGGAGSMGTTQSTPPAIVDDPVEMIQETETRELRLQ